MPESPDGGGAATSPTSRKRNAATKTQSRDAERHKVKAAAARQHVLDSLRSTTIVASKPVFSTGRNAPSCSIHLQATITELQTQAIVSLILDHVESAALIRCARVSRRLKDLVYDDSRWAQKLHSMGLSFSGGKVSGQRNRLDDRLTQDLQISEYSHSPLTAFDDVSDQLTSARRVYGRIHAALQPFYSQLDLPDAVTGLASTAFADPAQQAKLLANLRVFSKCDISPSRPLRVQRLQSCIDALCNDTLEDFKAAYPEDEDRMWRRTQIAVLLDNVDRLAQTFVDLHPIIRGEIDIPDVSGCLESVAVGHVDLTPCHEMLKLLETAISNQTFVVGRIFPKDLGVMALFISRLVDDIVRPFLDSIIAETSQKGPETFVKAVSGLYQHCMVFSDLTDFFSSQARESLAAVLTPHMENYFSNEQSIFVSKSSDQIKSWEGEMCQQDARAESYYMSNVNRQAAKRDFLSTFKQVVMLPVNVLPYAYSSKPVKSPKIDKIDTTLAMSPKLGEPSPAAEAPTTELAAKAALLNSRLEGINSLFSVELALGLINLAKTAIERIAIFARNGNHFRPQAKVHGTLIFVALITDLGERHVKPGFDKAIGHLNSHSASHHTNKVHASDKGVEPLVTFLELVNLGDLIQQMVDVFYSQELVKAGLTSTDDLVNPASKSKKRFEQMLDESVAAGLNKGIDVLMNEVERICATNQLASDYNPLSGMDSRSPVSPVMDIETSKTAGLVVDTVRNHTSMLVGSTDRQTLDVFFQEVGSRLFTVLCKHIKRQRINVDGAITLISDLNHYSEYITTLKQKPLQPYFSALRELSQIYLIDSCASSANSRGGSGGDKERYSRAKELASIISDTDRYHGVFRVEEVYEFAERRADWFAFKRDVDKAMYGLGCVVM